MRPKAASRSEPRTSTKIAIKTPHLFLSYALWWSRWSVPCGNEPPLESAELASLVKHIGQARRLRDQLDKRGDGRIVAQFADAGLSEDDLKDRDKLARTAAAVMAEVAKRHGELGQPTASYKQDLGVMYFEPDDLPCGRRAMIRRRKLGMAVVGGGHTRSCDLRNLRSCCTSRRPRRDTMQARAPSAFWSLRSGSWSYASTLIGVQASNEGRESRVAGAGGQWLGP
jgi:hypothetical protein